jgi:hypothetical protein
LGAVDDAVGAALGLALAFGLALAPGLAGDPGFGDPGSGDGVVFGGVPGGCGLGAAFTGSDSGVSVGVGSSAAALVSAADSLDSTSNVGGSDSSSVSLPLRRSHPVDVVTTVSANKIDSVVTIRKALLPYHRALSAPILRDAAGCRVVSIRP